MGCGGSKDAAPAAVQSKGGKDATSGSKLVMGRYQMHMDKASMMGQGSFSVCRKGTDTQTNKTVAVKVYKSSKQNAVTLLKFQRQIEVLLELLTPFKKPDDPRYWSERLDTTEPKNLFMELLDWSKSADGKPGPDPKDGVMYVITEIAQYSLKDYLALRRQQHSQSGQGLSKPSVRNITDAILQVMAGLHAKGLVHIDMKPENMMMFDGKLKLIDVDGCVKVGTNISITDSSISFSPCYCAPEWARFLIDESDSHITITPSLDVWSVGMTICELVTLDPVLKPMYASFLRNGSRPQQEAGFLFMEWLSSSKKLPLPRSVETFDRDFNALVTNKLLVCDCLARLTLAQCLADPYIAGKPKGEAPGRRPAGAAAAPAASESDGPRHEVDLTVVRKHAPRLEEELLEGTDRIVHHGALWKLNTGGNPMEPTQWLMRDMWINAMGNFCYFSQKEHKRLVLVDAHKMSSALIEAVQERYAREFVFKLTIASEGDDRGQAELVFATESNEDRDRWIGFVRRCAQINVAQTMKLGADLAKNLQEFRLTVRNRRMKVDQASRFDAVFTSKLWKVKSDGDRMKPEDWFQRDMWIAKNGSLVYWSAKEERELVYYTAVDVANARIVHVDHGDSARPWTFQVHVPEVQGMLFAPGEFSADSEELRTRWIQELNAHGTRVAP